MASQGQTADHERRAVDWSFPMHPSHLPPKSPGSFPSLGGGPADKRVVGHKRTPSAGYLPHTQATWMEGVVDAPEPTGTGAAFKRGAHRRSASESMAFLDGGSFSKMVDDAGHGAEDDDYESRSVASMHSGGHSGAGSVDFDSDNTWASERAPTPPGTGKQNSTDPATPSDSNSVASEVSNEDLKGGAGCGGKHSNKGGETDVQSSGGGDPEGGVSQQQTFSKQELQQALAGLDSSLDPKRAKRILANRQSAQRSRVRKLQYISELERSVTTLQSDVSTMAPRVAFFEHRRAVLNVDNNTIKQKMAALLQGQRFKDAHNEALQKEVQRLRQLYQQQHHQQHQIQQQQPQHLQLNPASSGYETQGLFNKLESMPGGNDESSSIVAVPDIFASTDPIASTMAASPTHSRSRSLTHTVNTRVASAW